MRPRRTTLAFVKGLAALALVLGVTIVLVRRNERVARNGSSESPSSPASRQESSEPSALSEGERVGTSLPVSGEREDGRDRKSVV